MVDGANTILLLVGYRIARLPFTLWKVLRGYEVEAVNFSLEALVSVVWERDENRAVPDRSAEAGNMENRKSGGLDAA